MSPIRRLLHWGPLASIVMTASITKATLSTKTNLIWISIFELTMCLTLYHMWCAALIGPGYISDVQEKGTAPNALPQAGVSTTPSRELKSRFCKRCCRNVLRKHHHCPWINNCVGQLNEQYFVRFLYFAIAVSTMATTILVLDTCQRNELILFNVLNIGLTLGVLIATSVLLYTH